MTSSKLGMRSTLDKAKSAARVALHCHAARRPHFSQRCGINLRWRKFGGNAPLIADAATAKGYAGTDFGGSPEWDGKAFTIYINRSYDNLSPSAQMTVDFQEFEHVALGDTDASRNGLDNHGGYPGSNVNLITIHKLCGTDLPKLD
jgi:hypothetical protein